MPWQSSRVLYLREISLFARALAVHAVGTARAAQSRVAALACAIGGTSWLLFWRELMAGPRAIGAVCASSHHLATRMAACVDPNVAGWVVELGGGTGVITTALLARGVPPERLIVIERSARLAALLRRRFPDLCVLHGDAAQLGELLASLTGDSGRRGVGQIVSGLPLLSIAEPVRSGILRAGLMALAPGGRLLQFTYAPRCSSPWTRVGLQCQERQWVLANLPPARIDVLVRREAH